MAIVSLFFLMLLVSIWLVNRQKVAAGMKPGEVLVAEKKPLAYLEGVRGIAAFLVVIHHGMFAFWPEILRHQTGPWYWMVSGTFEVAVFFVLSGLVLGLGPLKKQSINACGQGMLKRYVRLMWPILASSLLYFLFLVKGNFFYHQAMLLNGSDWLNQYKFHPSWPHFLRETLFRTMTGRDGVYNNVLWTMRDEFYGSLMIYALLVVVIRLRLPLLALLLPLWAGLIALSWFIHEPHVLTLTGFLMGLAIIPIMQRWRMPGWLATGCLLMGLWVGCMPLHALNVREQCPFVNWLAVTMGFEDTFAVCMWTLLFGALLVIVGVVFSPWAQRICGSRLAVWLGRISFSLYLLHNLVLFSLGCGLMVFLTPHIGMHNASLIGLLATVAVSLVLAEGFSRTIDPASIILAGRYSQWVSASLHRLYNWSNQTITTLTTTKPLSQKT